MSPANCNLKFSESYSYKKNIIFQFLLISIGIFFTESVMRVKVIVSLRKVDGSFTA